MALLDQDRLATVKVAEKLPCCHAALSHIFAMLQAWKFVEKSKNATREVSSRNRTHHVQSADELML